MSKRDIRTGFNAVAGGIALNRQVREVSGCRVNFDPRSTEQANETRSEINRKGKVMRHVKREQD